MLIRLFYYEKSQPNPELEQWGSHEMEGGGGAEDPWSSSSMIENSDLWSFGHPKNWLV